MWNHAARATAYRVQLSKAFDFTTTVRDTTNLPDTSVVIGNLRAATTYFWRVRAINSEVSGEWSAVWRFRTDTTLLTIGSGVQVPSKYFLQQNYPNPFNPETKIKYQIPNSNHVTLKVFDLLGREVATLVDELKPAGTFETAFDASKLSSGIYTYRLQAGEFVATRKFLLVR
ncbi:MAG: T9SS type A sorting domain-containing protein [Ignavibacteriae bacterium]|nr:T9SS type A sorting domain-containing protein [Ignavibacteriota bacterium]